MRQNIVQDLRMFGLSEYEARAYMALTTHGPLPASSVSDYSKIPQSKIYEVLKSLSSKCMTEYWNGKPLKYRAIRPTFALKGMLDQKKIKMELLRKKAEKLIRELKPLKENGFSSWSSNGREASLEKAAEMISRAKKFGFATTSHFSRYPSLDAAYSGALKRGVKIRMLGTADLDSDKRARASWYSKHGAEVRVLPMDVHATIGMIDDSEVYIRLDNSSSDSDVLWSNNPALVSIFRSYFKELWSRARKLRAY